MPPLSPSPVVGAARDVRVAGIPLSPGSARAYFALQAAAGAAWWILVFTTPPVREATLGPLDPVIVAALDLPLFVAASAVAACGVRAAVWAATVWTAIVAAGMALLATATGEAGWGALAMALAAVGSAPCAAIILRGRAPIEWMFVGPFAFRVAPPAERTAHVRRTGIQLAVFWGLFLGVIPVAMSLVERRWGLAVEAPLTVRIAGGAVFAAASALGLWSAAAMSTRGEGTPLPSATARRLVIAGPYRIVRNPMAVAGITQGVAVGLMLGSWLVVAWALCGSLVWNALIRPSEEHDLEERFGDPYRAYRDRVSCWIPRRIWRD
ncbi:methyltransferase family protein [Microbacterium sp. gxy059]|uniref:methyltransferase family protein n=1 Tax=Microbacterium sp. gxy059 TaxID=2957199 RepID=UPI003D989751